MPKPRTDGRPSAALVIAIGLGAQAHMAFGAASRPGEGNADQLRRMMLDTIRDPSLRATSRAYCRAYAREKFGPREG